MEKETANTDQLPLDQVENSEASTDESSETTTGAPEKETLSELEQMTVKLSESQDKYLRLSAEFDNYRKRTLKEKYELIKTAGEDLIKDLLPVVDDFDRALLALQQSADLNALQEGVQLIHAKLVNTLTQKGLKDIVALNQAFDSELFEAVTSVPVTDETLKGKIIDVVQKGYQLHDKVIRFPKVIVGE